MISYLIGTPILEKNSLTMLCGQVGYQVYVTSDVLSKAATETELRLHIYTHVKEEALELYGFLTSAEKEMFLLLLSVSGVGPKTALNILNSPTNQIVDAVQQANTSFFAATPRVGKKLAQKIIIDLRSKLGALKELDLTPLSEKAKDVFLALQALGYDDKLIEDSLKEVEVETLSSPEAITLAIKHIGRKK